MRLHWSHSDIPPLTYPCPPYLPPLRWTEHGFELGTLPLPVGLPHLQNGNRKATHLRAVVKIKLTTKEVILSRDRQNETFSTPGASFKMQCLLTPRQPQRATQKVPTAATDLVCPSLVSERARLAGGACLSQRQALRQTLSPSLLHSPDHVLDFQSESLPC